MKKIVALVFCLSLFVICSPVKVYAEGLPFTQKVLNVYYDFVQHEKVSKIVKSIKSGWESFKSWVANLPGIREYNDSVYSSKKWKKTMNSMGQEFGTHLKNDSAGAKMLREGKKNWDNL